jgi:hypothetical protein
MKKLFNLTTVLCAVAALTFVTGCASTGTTTAAVSKETYLQQAGFKSLTVTTAQQKQQVEKLAVGKVSAVKYKGKLFYVYPTAQKDHIYYGKQAQFNAYKQSLAAYKAKMAPQQQAQPAPQSQSAAQAQQGQQQMAGYATMTEETAGPNRIQVNEFDGFGPMTDPW